jgi:hypothetical protein
MLTLPAWQASASAAARDALVDDFRVYALH